MIPLALLAVSKADLNMVLKDRKPVPQLLPLHVADPGEVARRLRWRGIEAMCWPGVEQYAVDRAAFPGTRRWLDHGVCLPLGYTLTPGRAARVVEAVGEAAAVGVGTPSAFA